MFRKFEKDPVNKSTPGQESKKEVKFSGEQRKINGLTTWEYNEKTQEIKPAEFKEVSLNFKMPPISFKDKKVNKVEEHRYKLIVKQDCIYIQALNKENALRKLRKRNLI